MYLAVVGERCPAHAVDALLSLPDVDKIIRLPADRQIGEPISDHPDSLICICEGKLFVHSEYAKVAAYELSYIAERGRLEICTVECERDALYPLDCGFNALYLPDRHLLIGRRKSLAEPLKSIVNANTNQGYAGCAALYAGGHIITADPSMEKSAFSLNVPVYKIKGGDISLPGYNEGFIGGAGGAFERTVCLFGSPKHSESARSDENFCKCNFLNLFSLEDGPLTDRGGVKFVRTAE